MWRVKGNCDGDLVADSNWVVPNETERFRGGDGGELIGDRFLERDSSMGDNLFLSALCNPEPGYSIHTANDKTKIVINSNNHFLKKFRRIFPSYTSCVEYTHKAACNRISLVLHIHRKNVHTS